MDHKQSESSLWAAVKEVSSFCVALLGPVGTGILAIIVLIAALYFEENWRGRRAWAQALAQVKAARKETDWNNLIPPPVPDDQNFFAAPHMEEWFVGRGERDLGRRINIVNYEASKTRPDTLFAEVTIVPPDARVAPGDAEIVLSYHAPYLQFSTEPEPPSTNAPERIFPILALDKVPLVPDAVKCFAQQANLKYELESNLVFHLSQNESNTVPLITGRWTNLTALQALKSMLSRNDLILVKNPGTDVATVRRKNYNEKEVRADFKVAARLDDLRKLAVAPLSGGTDGPHLTTSLEFEVYARPTPSAKPFRIVVRSDRLPYTNEIAEFFSKATYGLKLPYDGGAVARATGTNTFEVFLSTPPRMSAADFLAWSEQFEPDFAAIRHALKRPYARMPGDYVLPMRMPIPNFVSLRHMAQHLNMRAESHLVLNQPDKALQDLMFMRDLCRLTEGRPTRRPMTIIAAVINSAITGLYVQTFGDGMRLGVWRESDLAAIEEQLKEVDLPYYLAAGMDCERVSACHLIERVTPQDWPFEIYGAQHKQKKLWEKYRDPMYCFLAFAPRGWFYQNMASIVNIHRDEFWGIFDENNGLILPHVADAAAVKIDRVIGTKSVFMIFPAIMIPNFQHAFQSVARNQTLVNEARIVCALGRYRFAHKNYPETPDALVPQFIDQLPRDLIGGQPLRYRREADDFTLYSVGWNEVDDQGKSYLRADGSGDVSKGDWVWLWGKKN